MASALPTAATAATIKSENIYMQLNESELTAIIMKGSPNSNDRDAGFCSGSSEGGDDLSNDHTRAESAGSPIDASDGDSLEVKVTPIALVRNKRKSSEPSRVVCDETTTTTATVRTTTAIKTLPNSSNGPLKKRIRYTSSADSAVALTSPLVAPTPTPTPTPPPMTTTPQIWDPSHVVPHELMPNPAQIFVRHPGATTLHRMPIADVEEQQEPLALVAKKRKSNDDAFAANIQSPMKNSKSSSNNNNNNTNNSTDVASASTATLCSSPKSKKLSLKKTASRKVNEERSKSKANLAKVDETPLLTAPPSVASSHEEEYNILRPDIAQSSASISSASNRPQQRNYKNMTRERRIEANARERTRVHTISAAYETLRRAVPSYSTAQKLSKLSVLRVACSYILTLSRMAGHDYSIDESEPPVSSCFEGLTSTILTEGKIKKKKDD